MGKVALSLAIFVYPCWAQNLEPSRGEVQASLAADMRGWEAGEAAPDTPIYAAGPAPLRWTSAPMPPVPPSESGVTSVARLLHKVPKRAESANARATKLAQSGKHLESSRELERAIEIDPAYADAHNNLGVQYSLLGRLTDAQHELLRAIELDPAFSAAFVNFGWVELQVHNLAAAEQYARRAMALSAHNDEARNLLDSVLSRTQR